MRRHPSFICTLQSAATMEPWYKLLKRNNRKPKEELGLCRNGKHCLWNQKGKCTEFAHSLGDEPAQKRRIYLFHGLKHVEDLDPKALELGEDDVCIEDQEDLASFNKFSNDEIIVPGRYYTI